MTNKGTYENQLLKAKQICALKETCAFDVEKKLEKWEVNATDIAKIILYLYDNKYIDDARYARAFANDKLKFNKWGKYKIRIHLKQKRVPEETIIAALNNLDDKIYYDILNDLINKKRPSIKGKSPFEIKAKLLRFIVGRGFEQDLALEIIDNRLND